MEQQLRIAVNRRRQSRVVLDDIRSACRLAVGLAGLVQQAARIELRRLKHAVTIEQLRRREQALHDARHAQHGAADARAAIGDLSRRDTAAHLDESLRVAIDDGQRRAKFMRCH